MADATHTREKSAFEDHEDGIDIITSKPLSKGSAKASPGGLSALTVPEAPRQDLTKGAWSQGETRRKANKGSSNSKLEALDLNASIMVAEKPRKLKPASANREYTNNGEDAEEGSDEDVSVHLPLAIRDQEMIARAFAGEDVVGAFQQEKRKVAEEEDEKVVDNTIPGWGSWIGDGISQMEKNRSKGKFLTKIPGVKKKDRKDAKLEKVIINEKRVKKVSCLILRDGGYLCPSSLSRNWR
jgi:U3 small nucleolar RNA-associated protein 14